MSRALALLLGENPVSFRQQLAGLEQAAGAPSADIRLSLSVSQAARQKIAELGLDPIDTTGHELYRVLQSRLRRDEILVRSSLNLHADIPVVDILHEVGQKIGQIESSSELYVVKQSVIKQIIKKLKPKSTMKRLGYRSVDSMLKHEAAAQLLAATLMCESSDWHKSRLDAYAKLETKDFELRKPLCLVPSGKRWPALADAYVEQRKNNIIPIPELGSIVIVPMSHDLPGLAVTTFVISLNAINDMRALSTYLKLQQVRPDFGQILRESVTREPLTEVEMGGRFLSWKIIHWFYGHGHSDFHPQIFEPHVQPEDMAWHNVGSALEGLHPTLAFWQETETLGLLDGPDAVSLNILDVALGVCNGLEYGERLLSNMRESLGRELFARYLHQENLQQMLGISLGKQLLPEADFTGD
ncbi:hypothetical protein KBD11_02450 [Candidatus Saccharibacteria bacterium]|nr:hypothetical protein [Candidatus Saccharibacteria bacterium]